MRNIYKGTSNYFILLVPYKQKIKIPFHLKANVINNMIKLNQSESSKSPSPFSENNNSPPSRDKPVLMYILLKNLRYIYPFNACFHLYFPFFFFSYLVRVHLSIFSPQMTPADISHPQKKISTQLYLLERKGSAYSRWPW